MEKEKKITMNKFIIHARARESEKEEQLKSYLTSEELVLIVSTLS